MVDCRLVASTILLLNLNRVTYSKIFTLFGVIKMRGNVTALNLHVLESIIKNMLDKVPELNAKDEADL